MSSFVINPNLPEKRVCKIICGTEDELILAFFEKEGIDVIKNKANFCIDPSVARHADMAALHLSGNSVIADKTQSQLICELENLGMSVFTTEKKISGSYPDDIKLNFALFGKYALGNFRCIDRNLDDLLSDKEKINVKQGYSKCSTLVLDESSIITDDASIYAEIVKTGLDCLLISKGDIFLEGHEYGFIGGASAKISKDEVLFFGDIRKHSNFDDIEALISSRCMKIICTDDGKLRDIGGIITLCENQ